MPVTTTILEDGRKVNIRIVGRFDFSAHKDFRSAYTDVDPQRASFFIDLSQAEYLDSAALGMLLVLRERAGGDRANIVIKGCQPGVRQIMEITRFGELFKIMD